MKSILDRSFRYTPSHATDLKRTFERIRRELQQKQCETHAKVQPLRGKKS